MRYTTSSVSVCIRVREGLRAGEVVGEGRVEEGGTLGLCLDESVKCG
jgi:hypothetical protein